jgi:hypothetical protein
MIEDSPYSKEDLAKGEEAILEFNKLVPEHLRPIFHDSRVRQTDRGIRRYFPLKAKTREGWDYIYEVFYMVYGKPINNDEVIMATVRDKLDYYIEEYNGKLWMRTIIYVD